MPIYSIPTANYTNLNFHLIFVLFCFFFYIITNRCQSQQPAILPFSSTSLENTNNISQRRKNRKKNKGITDAFGRPRLGTAVVNIKSHLFPSFHAAFFCHLFLLFQSSNPTRFIYLFFSSFQSGSFYGCRPASGSPFLAVSSSRADFDFFPLLPFFLYPILSFFSPFLFSFSLLSFGFFLSPFF